MLKIYHINLWICKFLLQITTLNLTITLIDLNVFETIVASLFFQFTLYVGLRLAHRGFTLGELGLVSFGGTALCLEFLNLTIARVRVTLGCH